MTIHQYFSADYGSARARFLEACKDAALPVESFTNTGHRTPSGDALVTDCVWVGPRDASSVLVTCSATHGVEGFYGSACQTGWLEERRYGALPADVAVLHVHAINPHGFAWLRRTNEDNVDINRNFIDFSRIPRNEAYAEIHGLIVPRQWDDATPAAIHARIAEYAAARGEKAFTNAVMTGQHTHPDGLFYGGRSPTWSNGVIARLCSERLPRARQIAVIDLHTGLGPYGHPELICRHPPGSPALANARRWYGSGVTVPQTGDSTSPPVDGNLRMAFERLCPRAQVTAIGIEVGTFPLDEVMMALYADNWLHLRGDPDSAQGRAITAEMRRAFFPEQSEWTEPVYAKTMEIMARAIDGLVGEALRLKSSAAREVRGTVQAWREAADIRVLVAAVLEQVGEGARAWATWALAEADRIDPRHRPDATWSVPAEV